MHDATRNLRPMVSYCFEIHGPGTRIICPCSMACNQQVRTRIDRSVPRDDGIGRRTTSSKGFQRIPQNPRDSNKRMMTLMAMRRLVCSALFLVVNTVYCGMVAKGYIGPVGAVVWGVIGMLWVVKLVRYRRRQHRKFVK